MDPRLLSEAADRLAIAEVLHRYARGLDAGDADLTLSCFSDDCVYHIAGETLRGREELRPLFGDPRSHAARTGLDSVDGFTHTMSNIEVCIDGERASALSIVGAHVLGARDGCRLIVVRCVRYRDALVRRGVDWLIAERRHSLQWAYEVTPTAVAPHPPDLSL